ncbi:MAG: O-antigen ligase family protein [Clostridiales bacterium]|nr:O-antigen ligase family protein [Clostridiales bacterium]
MKVGMGERNINYKQITVVSILYNVGMLFHQLLPQPFFVLASMLFLTYLNRVLPKTSDMVHKLFYASLLLVPTSFVSILGTSFGEFPLSWFHFLILSIFMVILLKFAVDVKYLLILLSFLVLSGITTFQSADIVDAGKQIITIVVLGYLPFIIGQHFKGKAEAEFVRRSVTLYLIGVTSFALMIFVQSSFIGTTGTVVGHSAMFGGGRITHAALMSDFSFANLYCATGAMIVLILFFEKKLSTRAFIFLQALFLVAMLLINARTGIFALFFAGAIYLCSQAGRMKFGAIVLLIISAMATPIVLNFIVESRGGQAFFDGSGRLQGYRDAINVFFEHPIIGVGFGLENLYTTTGLGVPHNYFVQYLVQSGTVGVALMMTKFFLLLTTNNRRKNVMRWPLYLVFVGAMFIPDIYSSRFLAVIIVIFMSNAGLEKNRILGNNT